MATPPLGWRRDLPDIRDVTYEERLGVSSAPMVDLRHHDTPIYDQGQLGSCTANAIAAHLDFNRKKQGEHIIHPSRLFIYYNERKAQGTVASDSGASIRESAKAVKKYGAPKEKDWPYVVSKFTDVPPQPVYTEAVASEDISYLKIPQKLSAFRSRISEGFPIVIGISVYTSFESVDKSGVVPIPATDEELLGGHAVMVLGYDDTKSHYIVRNSWGNSWGDKGYCYLPYDYVMNPNLSSDFWSLQLVK